MIIDDTVRSLLREVLAVHGAEADDQKGTGEWWMRAIRLEGLIKAALKAPGYNPVPGLSEALRGCRDYLDGIPESAAGGDDEARRLVRMADRALKSVNRAPTEKNS